MTVIVIYANVNSSKSMKIDHHHFIGIFPVYDHRLCNSDFTKKKRWNKELLCILVNIVIFRIRNYFIKDNIKQKVYTPYMYF